MFVNVMVFPVVSLLASRVMVAVLLGRSRLREGVPVRLEALMVVALPEDSVNPLGKVMSILPPEGMVLIGVKAIFTLPLTPATRLTGVTLATVIGAPMMVNGYFDTSEMTLFAELVSAYEMLTSSMEGVYILSVVARYALYLIYCRPLKAEGMAVPDAVK